jgi:HipA-like protein
MRSLGKLAKEWLGMKSDLKAPEGARADFVLYLGELPVGFLEVKKGKWLFKYTDQFKLKSYLRPIVEFPDLARVYENDELWQFFTARLPSTLQPDVEAVLEKEEISEDDVVALLKRFGSKTITSPFELRYESTV